MTNAPPAHTNRKKVQKKAVQPSSRDISLNSGTHAQPKASHAHPTDSQPDMSARRSGTPDAQVQGQNLSQTPGSRDSKATARSYDIAGPTHGSDGMAQDPLFGKPKRSGTNPNLTHHKVTEENDFVKRQNEDLQRQIDSSQRGMPDQDERMHQAEAQLRGVNRQLHESQERAAMLEIELGNLRAENERQKLEASITIQSMEKEYNQHKAAGEAQVRRLLDGATRNKVEGRWNPPPDEQIRHRLNLLNTTIREWTREWATRSLVLDKVMSAETTQYFGDFLRLDPEAGFPMFVRNPSKKTASKVAALLLHAALSREVYDAFFDGKFFCLKPEDRVILDNLYKEMKRADPTNAHIWRAGLWRLLNPTVQESANIPAILEASQANIRAYCDTVSATFLARPAGIPLFAEVARNSAEAEARATKLRVILLQASSVALSFWTQHSYYNCMDLDGLHSQSMTFDNNSQVLEAHPWSRVDEEDDKANGRGILMVSRPGILAFDADDRSGWRGGQYRVLSTAIVLLDGTY